jgi:hypothetical protein
VALLRGAGKSATALPLAQRALDIKLKVLGDSHLEVALALQTVAELMSDMGRWAVSLHLLNGGQLTDADMPMDTLIAMLSESALDMVAGAVVRVTNRHVVFLSWRAACPFEMLTMPHSCSKPCAVSCPHIIDISKPTGEGCDLFLSS